MEKHSIRPLGKDNKHSFWLATLAILVLTFITYSSSAGNGYIWDDDYLLTNNPFLNDWSGLYKIWFSLEYLQFYPVTSTSFFFEMRLWGLNPFWNHLTNVLIHALNSILVWQLLRKLNITAAFVIALIFAVHPVQVESVAWISERKNVLSGLFYLLSLYYYLKFDENERKSSYFFSLFLFFLALGSKTVTSTLPAILLIVSWMRGRNPNFKGILRTAPFFLLGVGMGLLTVFKEKYSVGAVGEEWNISLAEHLLLPGKIMWFYIVKLLWPAKIAFIYPRWTLNAAQIIQWVPSILILSAGLSFLFCVKRIGRAPLAALTCYAVTLFPALGFFNVYPMRYSFVANHFQYLAFIPVVSLIIGGLVWSYKASMQNLWLLQRFGYSLHTVVFLLVVSLSALSWNLGFAYKSSQTLWEDTLAKNPEAWMAYNNLALIYSEKGESAKAEPLFLKSIQLKPDDGNAYNNLGMLYAKDKQYDRAMALYRKAIELNPRYDNPHNNLGIIFYHRRDYTKAAEHFRKAIECNSKYAEAYFNLGLTYYDLKDYGKAIEAYLKAAELNPKKLKAFNNLGAIYSEMKDYDKALQCYQRAIQINPEYAFSHENVAIIYFQQKRYQEALQKYKEAIQLQPDDPSLKSRFDLVRRAIRPN